MASHLKHIEQWKHNRAFLATISAEYPDWVVTAAFYAALHAIDALLTFDGVPAIVSHDARNRTLRQTNRYQKLYKAYEPLYSLSRTVRYLAEPRKWIAAAEIPTRVFTLLHEIETSVFKLTKADITPPTLSAPSA